MSFVTLLVRSHNPVLILHVWGSQRSIVLLSWGLLIFVFWFMILVLLFLSLLIFLRLFLLLNWGFVLFFSRSFLISG